MNDVALSPLDQSESVVDSVLLTSRVLVAIAARSLSDIAEEVTLSQFRTLVVLATQGSQSLSGLSEIVGVNSATATRMCDRLVKKRLIHRHSEPGNRRQLRLVLTKKGQALVDAVTQRRRGEIERIMNRIPLDDQVLLVQALRLFSEAAGEVPEQYWTTGWDL
jgi:DNA-binding MarR family transcriptional regulator